MLDVATCSRPSRGLAVLAGHLLAVQPATGSPSRRWTSRELAVLDVERELAAVDALCSLSRSSSCMSLGATDVGR